MRVRCLQSFLHLLQKIFDFGLDTLYEVGNNLPVRVEREARVFRGGERADTAGFLRTSSGEPCGGGGGFIVWEGIGDLSPVAGNEGGVTSGAAKLLPLPRASVTASGSFPVGVPRPVRARKWVARRPLGGSCRKWRAADRSPEVRRNS